MMLFTNSAFSQGKFWKNLQVRKAFETSTEDDDKAANLLLTFPKDSDFSYVVNAGLGYKFMPSTKSKKGKTFKNSFSGFFVFNRNNLIDKEQKNYKLGLTANQIFYTDTANTAAFFGAHTVEYLRDYMEGSHSMLLTTYWHPFLKKKDKVKLGGYVQKKELMAYYFLPQLGLEYQNILKTTDGLNEGNDLRGFFSLKGSLLIKKKTFDEATHLALEKNRWTKGVEFTVSYDGRYSLFEDVNKTDKYTPLFKSEVVLYPTQDNKFSVGFSYNNGSNPIDGLTKQNFWLLAFKFKK